MPFVDLPPAPPALPVLTFDLEQLPRADAVTDPRAVRPRCSPGGKGEIVVCAPDPEKQRLRPLPDSSVMAEGLPRAELRLGENASVDLHVEAHAMPGGAVSNRLMVGAKIKF